MPLTWVAATGLGDEPEELTSAEAALLLKFELNGAGLALDHVAYVAEGEGDVGEVAAVGEASGGAGSRRRASWR